MSAEPVHAPCLYPCRLLEGPFDDVELTFDYVPDVIRLDVDDYWGRHADEAYAHGLEAVYRRVERWRLGEEIVLYYRCEAVVQKPPPEHDTLTTIVFWLALVVILLALLFMPASRGL